MHVLLGTGGKPHDDDWFFGRAVASNNHRKSTDENHRFFYQHTKTTKKIDHRDIIDDFGSYKFSIVFPSVTSRANDFRVVKDIKEDGNRK